MHEIETRRPCHHEPLGLTDADCCRCILAAGADALATCRACRRGQALARTTGQGWLRPLPPVLPVPGMRALETGRVVEEEAPQARSTKRRVAVRTVKRADRDVRPVRASTAMAMGMGTGMSTGGGSGNRREDLTGAATGPAMMAHGGMNEMDDRDDMPGAGAALPLDDGDWQAPWEELVMPEPEGLESEEDMKDKLEEAQERDEEQEDTQDREELRAALASVLALAINGFGAPGPVRLAPLRTVWPIFYGDRISEQRLADICTDFGLQITTADDATRAVALDDAARIIAREAA